MKTRQDTCTFFYFLYKNYYRRFKYLKHVLVFATHDTINSLLRSKFSELYNINLCFINNGSIGHYNLETMDHLKIQSLKSVGQAKFKWGTAKLFLLAFSNFCLKRTVWILTTEIEV